MITNIENYKLFKESLNYDKIEFKWLLTWWGARGYLYYNSLKPGTTITDEGKRMLKVIYDSKSNGYKHTTDDYKNDPIWCDENVWKEITKGWVDNTFKSNMITLNKPTLVSKSYDEEKRGFDKGWYSFSIGSKIKGQFGDLHIKYMLPKGFKVVDTIGLADQDEILIWGKDLAELTPLI